MLNIVSGLTDVVGTLVYFLICILMLVYLATEMQQLIMSWDDRTGNGCNLMAALSSEYSC